MHVYQVMRTDPLAVDVDDDLSDAYELMHENALDELPVLEDGRLVGCVTEADLHAAMEPDEGLPADTVPLTVAALVRHQPAACRPQTTVAEAGELMDARGVGHVFVTAEDGRLLGAVDDTDLVDWYGDGDDDGDLDEMLPLLKRYVAERCTRRHA